MPHYIKKEAEYLESIKGKVEPELRNSLKLSFFQMVSKGYVYYLKKAAIDTSTISDLEKFISDYSWGVQFTAMRDVSKDLLPDMPDNLSEKLFEHYLSNCMLKAASRLTILTPGNKITLNEDRRNFYRDLYKAKRPNDYEHLENLFAGKPLNGEIKAEVCELK